MTRQQRPASATFSWDNEQRIVEGLEKQFPRVSRMDLSGDDLDKMIRGLPGFINGDGPPDDEIYNRILILWISLDDDEMPGRWDAEA